MDGCSLSISISQVKIFRKWIERITKQLGSFGGEIKMNGRCAKLMKAIYPSLASCKPKCVKKVGRLSNSFPMSCWFSKENKEARKNL